ncbi:hypothetical protein [Donghicola tyrosinivorans]|uniref:hypothetical protein n=1 Tax=Donghicola tyrosinivorans TaxID=1652492 RepID=UPI000D078CF3|nr:hypothetical protein [Donghicola tyrosinivorans]
MAGKLCIHPKQVAGVNKGFSPNSRDIDNAKRIVAAAKAADVRGALQLDGKLIDKPVVDRARRLLETLERPQP